MSGNPPQGQQNPLSAFGFKQPSTSNTNNTSASGGFGGFASAPSSFGGGAAGQNNATNTSDASAASKAPLFGSGEFGISQNTSQGAQQSTPSGTGGSGIFGSSSGTSPFGSTAVPPSGQTNNIFGGSTPASGGASSFSSFGSTGGSTPANPTTAGSNPLFGSATNQTTPSTTAKSIFGNSSTTPAAPPGGLFGTTSSAQPAQASGSSLGPSGNNVFGGTPSKAPSGGLFGGTTTGGISTNNATPSLNIFGASNNNQGSNNQPTIGAANPNNVNNASAPSPLFGNAPSSTPPASTTAKPSPFGALGAFSTKSPDASGQPAASTLAQGGSASTPSSLFGGSNTANTNKSSTFAPSGNASSTPPASGMPSLFANLPKKPEAAPASGASPIAAPSPFSGFPGLTAPKDTGKDSKATAGGSLFGPAASAPDASKDLPRDAASNKDGVPAPSPFAAFSPGGNKDAGSPKPPATSGPASTAAASTVVVPSIAAPTVSSVPAPSMLRGKTVEDIVNRWTTELETHAREFSQFASEVAVWDRTLIENGNYISALYATVLAAESTQTSLDQSLEHVEQQQRHLTDTLDQYEKSASEILHGPGGIMTSNEGLGLADSERDKSYALAANLYTQLDDLSRSITQMVESVNNLNLSAGPSQGSSGTEGEPQEDAISTIAGILNAHLSSLQWIDGSLQEMDGKIRDAERKIKDTSGRSAVRSEGISKGRSYGLGSSRR